MGTIKFIGEFTLHATISILPFFFISIAVASLIKTFKFESYLKKAFHGKEMASIPIATTTGAFSPLCSCGVIPAISAMLSSGIPLAPIMAFWIASPLMSPESFVLTYSILGSEMAIARLIATIAIGLIAGYITLHLTKSGFLGNKILKIVDNSFSTDINDLENDLSKTDVMIVRMLQFLLNLKDMAIFVGKYIIIAFVVEAIIILYVPIDVVGNILGNSNKAGPILAAFIGVPAYASSISAMPVVRGLIDLGMDKGTALSFLIGGAATSIPAMIAVFSIVKKKVFIIYISISMIGAILCGYVYRLF
jgi:hypothetical protein